MKKELKQIIPTNRIVNAVFAVKNENTIEVFKTAVLAFGLYEIEDDGIYQSVNPLWAEDGLYLEDATEDKDFLGLEVEGDESEKVDWLERTTKHFSK